MPTTRSQEKLSDIQNGKLDVARKRTLGCITNLGKTGERITRSTFKLFAHANMNQEVPSIIERSKKSAKVSQCKRKTDEQTDIPPSKQRKLKKNGKEGKISVKETHQVGTTLDKITPVPEEISPLAEQFKKLEEILNEKYVNVVDRLKLYFTPYCSQNIGFCRIHHSKKCPRPDVADIYQISYAKELVTHDRPLTFLKTAEDMCLRTVFPGENILSTILELLLTITCPEDAQFPAKYVIIECIIVFEKLISKFPPCWQEIRLWYSKFLNSSINMKKILPEKNSSEDNTFFTFIIYMLEKIMYEEDTEPANTTVNQTCDTESDFFNFHEWESKYAPSHTFEAHSRADKLDRLFFSLHLITKILEIDLSLWLLRFPSNPKKHVFADEKPLIAELFGMNNYKQITNLVKKTLDVFVSCVCFCYPETKIDILSRLISLLSVVINLWELESSSKGIIYPTIGTGTETFAKEIFKTIENFDQECLLERQVEIYLAVIKYIKIPFTMYTFINIFLNKLDSDQGKMCPEKIARNFNKKKWLEYPRKQEKEIKDCKNTGLKYPIVTKNIAKAQKHLDIYRQEYTDLLLEALKAYCDTFEMKKAVQIFKKTDSSASSVKTSSVKVPQKNTSKLKLEAVANDIDKITLHLKLTTKRLVTDDGPRFEGVVANTETMLSYRKDLKYLMILKKIMSEYDTTYNNYFSNWLEFLENDIFQNEKTSM